MADLVTRIIITATDKASGVLNALKSNAATVAAAIIGFFGFRLFDSAIEDAQKFEKQMDTVAAVSGATAEQLKLLEQAAKELGASTEFTAFQAALALESLARAGLDANQQIQALPEVLSLAQANSIELAEAANFITQAVIGMGLEFSESGRVADVLTKAAASANTSVRGLGAGLAYAAPIAQDMGLSLEQTVALLAQMANAGIDASRAGTSLNGIMLQFKDPASKFRKELSNLGIDTNNFSDALTQLASKGDAGNAAILSLGTEAGPALTALFNQGVPALEGLQKSLEESAGAAKAAADIMSENLDGAKKSFGSVWDAIKLQLAQPILEPLTDGFKALTTLFQSFLSSGLADSIGQSIGNAFSFAIDVGGQLQDTINSIYTRLSESGAIENFSNAFDSALTRVIDLSNNVIDIIVDIANVLLDSSSIDKYRQAFDKAFDSSVELAQKLWDSIKSLYALFDDTASTTTFGDALGSVLVTLIESVTVLVSGFTTGLSVIETAFHSVVSVGQSFFSSFVSGIALVQEQISKITVGDLSERFAADAEKSRLIAESFAEAMQESNDKAAAALKKTADSSIDTRNALRDLYSSSNDASEATEKLAEKQDELGKAVGDVVQPMHNLSLSVVEVAVAQDKASESSKTLSYEVDGITRSVEKATTAGITFGFTLDDNSEKMDKARTAAEAYQERMEALTKQHQHFNDVLNQEAAAIASANQAWDDRQARREAEDKARDSESFSAFSASVASDYAQLNSNSLALLEAAIESNNNAAFSQGRVKVDIEELIKSLANSQNSAAEAADRQEDLLTSINQGVLNSSVIVKLDGQEIAASIARAGQTSR